MILFIELLRSQQNLTQVKNRLATRALHKRKFKETRLLTFILFTATIGIISFLTIPPLYQLIKETFKLQTQVAFINYWFHRK